MKCFIDYIGLRHCTDVEPESGFYINDMAGVSLQRMDNISNQEKKSFVGVWEAIQRRAAFELEARILNKFTSYYKINKDLDNSTFGYFNLSDPFLEVTPTFKGIMLYSNHRTYTKVNIDTVELYSSVAYEGAKLYVYDLNKGTKLKEVTVDLTEGYNSVKIGFETLTKTTSYGKWFVGYDASIMSLKKSVPSFLVHDYTVENTAYVQDGTINSPFISSSFIASSEGSGLSLQYRVECSLEAFVCERKQLFKHAWAKLLVAEIFNETLNSNRTNYFTTIDRDQAMLEYQKNMSDFNMSIGDVLDNIEIPQDNICFDCNTIVSYNYLRP